MRLLAHELERLRLRAVGENNRNVGNTDAGPPLGASQRICTSIVTRRLIAIVMTSMMTTTQ
jgi:hypothetical protein